MRQEAGDGAQLVEGFNYNVRGLRNTYRYFRDNLEEAERFARTEDHAADPVSIANLALANRNGNGDADSGDGWTYRGRGLFQLTGRGNYRAFTEWHEGEFGEGIDFENTPVILLTVEYPSRHDLPQYVQVLDSFAFRASDIEFSDVTCGPLTDIALTAVSAFALSELDMVPPIRVQCLLVNEVKPFEFFEQKPK